MRGRGNDVRGRRRRAALLAALLALAFGVTACVMPRDPERTLQRVRGETLVVGLLQPAEAFQAGDEAAALRRLAESLDARVRYAEGGLHDQLAALHNGSVHLLAGRIPETTPLASELALTRPWGRITVDGEDQAAVFALRKGENAFLLAVDRGLSDR